VCSAPSRSPRNGQRKEKEKEIRGVYTYLKVLSYRFGALPSVFESMLAFLVRITFSASSPSFVCNSRYRERSGVSILSMSCIEQGLRLKSCKSVRVNRDVKIVKAQYHA
jgi:hypothetical protein